MSKNNVRDLKYSFFVVDEKPYCLWGFDIKKRTLEFLESLDPSYFEYIANEHGQRISDEIDAKNKKSQHAALVIRTTYSQALETLFALICATVQACHCVPAWIYLYKNSELRNIIDKIHNNKPILSQFKFDVLTWSSISKIIFKNLIMEDKEKESAIKRGFAQLWSRFATDFLDDEFTEEYNSIKHGFRILTGGFSVAIGTQSAFGIPAPAEKMSLLGKSDFGTGYIAVKKIGNLSNHIQTNRHHRNWNPEDNAWGLHLTSMSISNIQSALKILNGVPPDKVQFFWPTDLSTFLEPWKRSAQIGVTSVSGFSKEILTDYINMFPKEKILADYNAGQYDGVIHLTFSDSLDSPNEMLNNSAEA